MILVAGATGTLGGIVARRLLDRREWVRILARPGSGYQPLVEAGAEAVLGDLRDPESLRLACRGVEVVVTTANSALRRPPDTPRSVDVEGNRTLVDAARAAGVHQFVFISALGATEDSPIPLLAAKAATERYLRESGITYTILAPDLFMEAWISMLVTMPVLAGRPVTLPGEGTRRHSMVSIRDVAAFVAAVTRNPIAYDRYLPVGGPVAVSWRDVVAAAERTLGRSIPVRTLRPGASIPGVAEVVSRLAEALEGYDSVLEMSGAARAFGVELTPMETFLRAALAPRPVATTP